MVERPSWRLLPLLGIALAGADVELPERLTSCSETNEELCETTSLLQLSLVHSETSHSRRHQASQKEQKTHLHSGAAKARAATARELELHRQFQHLSTDRRARKTTREHKLDLHRSAAVAAAADVVLKNLLLDPGKSEDEGAVFNACDDEQLSQGRNAMEAVRENMPSALCKSEYAVADASLQDAQGDKCTDVAAARNDVAAYLKCISNFLGVPELGEFELYVLSAWQTNLITALLILFVVVNLIFGWSASADKNSCPAWVVTMLVVSYICFVTGFFANNTSWLLMARNQNGLDSVLTMDIFTGEKRAVSESPYRVIADCIAKGGYARLAGYAFLTLVVGDPVVKLLFMLCAEALRYRPATVGTARKMVIFVRVTAKWASPLHFFILTYHCQFLGMNDPPYLKTNAVLDIGWLCFTIFCLTNVVSALSIAVPALPYDQRNHSTRGLSERCKVFLFLVTMVAASTYFVLLGVGCTQPLFSLNDEKYSSFFSKLDDRAVEALHSTSTLAGCTFILLKRFLSAGQLIPLLAFFVMLVGVILVALADMCALAFACYQAYKGDNSAFSYWLSVSRFTRHCALVDVLLAGIALAYVSRLLILESGVYTLFFAELIRYFVIYFVVENVAVYLEVIDDSPMNRHNRHLGLTSQIPGFKPQEEPRTELGPEARSKDAGGEEPGSSSKPPGVIRMSGIAQDAKPALPTRCSDNKAWEREGARGLLEAIAA